MKVCPGVWDEWFFYFYITYPQVDFHITSFKTFALIAHGTLRSKYIAKALQHSQCFINKSKSLPSAVGSRVTEDALVPIFLKTFHQWSHRLGLLPQRWRQTAVLLSTTTDPSACHNQRWLIWNELWCISNSSAFEVPASLAEKSRWTCLLASQTVSTHQLG